MTHALVAVALAALVAGCYALSCWLWPFTRCSFCKGTSRTSRDDGKVWRPCRWCRGTGRRIRVGRWIYNKTTAGRRTDG